MPDCRGVGESRIYSKCAKKVPLRNLSLSLTSQVGITINRQNKGFIIWWINASLIVFCIRLILIPDFVEGINWIYGKQTNRLSRPNRRSTYLERILWKFLYTYSVVIWIFSQTLRIYFTIVYFVSIILAMFSKKSTERRIWEKLPIIW